MSDVPARRTCTIRSEDGEVAVQVCEGTLLISPFVGNANSPIQVGCRGGGCGVCRVEVLEGGFEAKRMSRRFVTEDEAAAGYALACRMIVNDDIVVRWSPVTGR